MKTALIGCIAAALATTGADAGFAGFVAFSRNVGANTVIDIFAGVQNASDRFLNVYDLEFYGNGVVQKAGLATKTWKPDTAGFTSTRNTSDDSFMTSGTFSGGAYGGEYYASANTNADPNFTGTSWNATPVSPAATSIPSNAGWYTADPTSIDNNAENMGVWGAGFTRYNSKFVSGFQAGGGSAASSIYGIWVWHLVVAGTNQTLGGNINFIASASIKDGVTGATTQARYYTFPSPSALALLSLSGLASRRRRS